MRRVLSHWTHTVLVFLLAIVSGFVLLPLLRQEPKSLHGLFGSLPNWIGCLFVLFCCIVFALAAFKLFAPRHRQLLRWKSHPPSWCGFLAGLFIVFLVDVNGGLGAKIYDPTIAEWLGYAGGSALVALVIHWLNTPESDSILPVRLMGWLNSEAQNPKVETEASEEAEACLEPGVESESELTIQNASSVQWELLEAWMANESLAEHDFYQHRTIANRLAGLLTDRTRSIGLVGPFGSGKSTIVRWIKSNVQAYDKANDAKLLFSEHSCWGFKNSSGSIHAMLAGAVNKVQDHIDTLRIRSLPDSYRKTFSAGGKWFDSLSNMMLGQADPNEQFERLSDLMKDIGARLVFVVDDLDRNNSSSFDIQEVLAFLHQLKQYDNISFILSAGRSDTLKIDFAKLCDHVEYLPLVGVEQTAELILRVRNRCLDMEHFEHHVLTETHCHWDKISYLLLNDYNKVWPPQAVAALLNTPRSMRHTLGRTYAAWKKLFGEVDWDHLLALNTLRYAAPEAFDFLFANWNRLRYSPHESNSFGKDQTDGIKKRLMDEWSLASENAEWHTGAAQTLIEFLLPAAEAWYGERSTNDGPIQGLDKEKYWLRATREYIDPACIHDQTVYCDIKDWFETQNAASNLVTGICGSEEYCALFEYFGHKYLGGRYAEILLLCEQVINQTLAERGNAAGGAFSIDSMRRFAERFVSNDEANIEWIKRRIDEAIPRSLTLAVDYWHDWVDNFPTITPFENKELIREYLVDELPKHYTDVQSLVMALNTSYPYILYQLIFDFSKNTTPIAEVTDNWKWLMEIVLEALREKDLTVAANVAVLMTERGSGGRTEPWRVSNELLEGFFGSNAKEVIDVLDELSETLEETLANETGS